MILLYLFYTPKSIIDKDLYNFFTSPLLLNYLQFAAPLTPYEALKCCKRLTTRNRGRYSKYNKLCLLIIFPRFFSKNIDILLSFSVFLNLSDIYSKR